MLGPLLYIIYTGGIVALFESFGLLHQLHADDVQAYTHCTSDQAVAAVAQMCLAMDALSAWLASNCLLLMLPRLNLSGWEVADVWLVLTGPLLPLPFQTFAFKIQFETWGHS